MMKPKIIVIVFSVILLSFTACGGRNSNTQSVHTHADGSVHEDHTAEQTAPKQESFKVESDGTTVDADSVGHNHDHDHSHDGHDHKH